MFSMLNNSQHNEHSRRWQYPEPRKAGGRETGRAP
jgi:hypothetical protein